MQYDVITKEKQKLNKYFLKTIVVHVFCQYRTNTDTLHVEFVYLCKGCILSLLYFIHIIIDHAIDDIAYISTFITEIVCQVVKLYVKL